jgi:polyisoprenyl-teichoic acid--peptidoglycan teichoic acid transferase
VTEVAPHVGRRARREAEGRQPLADTPPTRTPYGSEPAFDSSHAGGRPGPAPDTSLFAPASAGAAAESLTGYLPPAVGGPAPAWHPDAAGYARPYGYAPSPTEGHLAPSPGLPGRAPAPGYRAPAGYAPSLTSTPPALPRAAASGPATAPPGWRPPAAPPGAAPSVAAPPAAGPPAGAPRPPARPDDAPGGPDQAADGRGRHATEWGEGFEHVVGWTLLGSLVPGVGMIAAGRRILGGVIAGSCLLVALAGAAVLVLSDPVLLIARLLLTHPERLTYVAGAMVLLAVLWGAHVVATNLFLRRFATLTGRQSTLSWALVAAIVGGGVAGTVVQAQNVQLGADTINSIFSDGGGLSSAARRPDTTKVDPWANTPRVNVLLIGSDAGADRTGLRTDSLIVASIDTRTGRAVLFSLPRNLEHVPFPPGTPQARDYPDGYYCAQDACMINALWQFGMEHKDQYYKGVKNPGLKATVDGVEQTLGLTIDQYAMVDLRGFMQFVDAIGGLDVNVTKRIPVGGHRDPATGRSTGVTSYIEKGRQHLDGYRTLWFARSRSDSDDFERMRRQRCVIGAVTQQIDPQTVALNITGILKAAKDNIRTSIPTSDLDAWVALALKVKKGAVQSVAFTNKIITPGNPDFELIKTKVQDALKAPVAKPTPSATTPSAATPSPTTKKKPAPVAETGDAVDVNQVC